MSNGKKSDLYKLRNRIRPTIGGTPDFGLASTRTAGMIDSLTQDIEEGYDRYKTRNINAVSQGVELLPELAKLIRNEEMLINFEKTYNELATKAERHAETAPVAQFIKGYTNNLREDYNMYSTSMEVASNIIDSDDFLDTASEFTDIGKHIKKFTLDDGKTPKYEGAIDFLVTENDRINSLIGRIGSASKGMQFKYNKDSKYTDQEILEKLSSYQKRLSVAVQTAIGNGQITPQEAEYIMIGDIKTYNNDKKEKIKQLNSQFKMYDSSQSKIKGWIQKLKSDEMKNADKSLLMAFASQITDDIQEEAGEDTVVEELEAINIPQMIEDLENQNKQIRIAKERVKSSYELWQGRPMFDAPPASPSSKNKLLENIMEDDGNDVNNVLKSRKIKSQADLQKVLNKYNALPPDKKSRFSNWKDYANVVYNFNIKLDTDKGNKKNKKSNFDIEIKKKWDNLSKEDKTKYKTLANFKKNWINWE